MPKFNAYRTKIKSDELYSIKYDVDIKDINLEIPRNFFDLVTDNKRVKQFNANTRLYNVSKNEIDTSRKVVLLKDFGRSGKGLFMATFEN